MSDLLERRRHALVAAGIGTLVEFFDYASYSYLATTIAAVFFPGQDRTTSLLETFAVFALSFVMRPVGGIFWGHYGDRLGRKKTMVLTILGMGVATLAIGVLPGFASIGFWAPAALILIRLLQSFCTAGQYSGAALVAGEFAPPLQRARFVSVVPIGSAAGFLLASALSSWLHGSLAPDDMLSWGWRIPFVIGGVLTLAGWLFRRGLEETPDFEHLRDEDTVAEAPLKVLLRSHLKLVASLVCIVAVAQSGYYLVLAYMATYLEVGRGFSAKQAAEITTIALVAYIPLLYVFASAADRFGRRKILFASSILFILAGYPAFIVLAAGGFGTALLVQLFLVAILALNDSTVATFFLESFPPNVRFSGFALPFNIGAAVFGGASPLLAEWLIHVTGNEKVPALMMMGVAGLSLPALCLVRETAPGIIGQPERGA